MFVYDDKVVLTFNYSGDDRTITLHEIDAGLQQGVQMLRPMACQKSARFHSETGHFSNFFGLFMTYAYRLTHNTLISEVVG